MIKDTTLDALCRLLAEKDVAEKFAAMAPPPDAFILEELNANGEKLHRHLANRFPSIANAHQI